MPARNKPRSKQLRRSFLVELARQVRVLWPILSGLIFAMATAGIVIGRIEDWQIDEALYFTFVTGLTIGYGDLTPKYLSTRLLALAIGLAGIVLIGLVSAISVQALNASTDRNPPK